MAIKFMEICKRCGKVDKDGTMEYDEHANGYICDRCANKREIEVLSQ